MSKPSGGPKSRIAGLATLASIWLATLLPQLYLLSITAWQRASEQALRNEGYLKLLSFGAYATQIPGYLAIFWLCRSCRTGTLLLFSGMLVNAAAYFAIVLLVMRQMISISKRIRVVSLALRAIAVLLLLAAVVATVCFASTTGPFESLSRAQYVGLSIASLTAGIFTTTQIFRCTS